MSHTPKFSGTVIISSTNLSRATFSRSHPQWVAFVENVILSGLHIHLMRLGAGCAGSVWHTVFIVQAVILPALKRCHNFGNGCSRVAVSTALHGLLINREYYYVKPIVPGVCIMILLTILVFVAPELRPLPINMNYFFIKLISQFGIPAPQSIVCNIVGQPT